MDIQYFDNYCTAQNPDNTPNHLAVNLYGKQPKVEDFTYRYDVIKPRKFKDPGE